MRVSQQLDYWARLAYVPRERRAELVAINLQRFGLEEFAERRVDRMSQGQRQRIRLAMAFLHEPRVLLLDEPRNSLDDDGYQLLGEQIERAAGERRHDPVVLSARRGPGAHLRHRLHARRRPPGAGRMRLWVRTRMWGIIRRDAILFVSYRSQLVAQFLGPLFSITLFYYISQILTAKTIHSPGGYFGFVVDRPGDRPDPHDLPRRDARDRAPGTRLGHDRALPRQRPRPGQRDPRHDAVPADQRVLQRSPDAERWPPWSSGCRSPPPRSSRSPCRCSA